MTGNLCTLSIKRWHWYGAWRPICLSNNCVISVIKGLNWKCTNCLLNVQTTQDDELQDT